MVMMKKSSIPVLDICSIDERSGKDLLIERFGAYLEKHYENLHRPHRHSFYHMVLFTKGKGSHTIDFEKYPVKPFQAYFMIPGQVHSWHFEGGVDGYILHFNEVLFSTFLHNSHYLGRFHFFSGYSHDGVCQLPSSIHAEATGLFEAMLREVNEPTGDSLDMVRLRILELFILIDRNFSNKEKKNVPAQKLVTFRAFRQLIEKHFRSIRLPKEYADLLYITPNHLNALSQDMMGKSAGDLIRDRVILEAKRLLTNGDMTITEIAYNLNFPDNSYFNRFFKKYTGMTPDGFRKDFIQQ